MHVGRRQCPIPQIAIVVCRPLAPVVVVEALVAHADLAPKGEIDIALAVLRGNVFEGLPPGTAAGLRIGQIGVVLVVSRRRERRRAWLCRLGIRCAEEHRMQMAAGSDD
jgi:hypothetical protein